MGKLTEMWVPLWVVLLAALSQAVTEDTLTPTYFTDGGELTLNVTPPYTEVIGNILWKFNGDLLADWLRDKGPIELYGTFNGRSTLDTDNGRLVISKLSKADMGKYSVEINSNLHGKTIDAKWVSKVTKPNVVLRPLVCGSDSESCMVICVAKTTETGPVTYSWKLGNNDWMESKYINISKKENSGYQSITCRISNPVSQQDSEPITNPFYSNNIVVTVILCLVGVGFGVGAIVMSVLWKQKKGPFKNRNNPKPDSISRPQMSPSPSPQPTTIETNPLKSDSQGDM